MNETSDDPGKSTTMPVETTMEAENQSVKTTLGNPWKPNDSVHKSVPNNAKSLAEIMAEETADRDAVLIASDYGGSMAKTLAEMQAEQERIFMLLQTQKESIGSNSLAQQPPPASASAPIASNPDLDEEERRMIEMAMAASLQDQSQQPSAEIGKHIMDYKVAAVEYPTGTQSESDRIEPKDLHNSGDDDVALSEEEKAAIQAAIDEANAKEESESLRLALQLQQDEINRIKVLGSSTSTTRSVSMQKQGHVRTLTRQQLEEENRMLHEAVGRNSGQTISGVASQYDYGHPDDLLRPSPGSDFGFRMNAAPGPSFLDSQTISSAWTRRDRNTIVGPNNELRTKHDPYVEGQTNAEFLDLDIDDYGVRAHVGNKAFNSFRQTMKQRSTTKGVASHGTGRAGSDTAGTRGKAMDPNVRLQVDRQINNGLIRSMNGAVKQGKEAVVYHAYGGTNSCSSDTTSQLSNEGFDVAIKVFKRITEFRSRGEYVDGDPRYNHPFRNFTERQQLELWTEKEYRNLIRAHRGGVPVPTPIHHKENIIFMRFMGTDCWPAPQIREINIRKGSSKWLTLYNQVLESMRRLYRDAKLIHGDLSEYNILICPVSQVDNRIASDGESSPKSDDLQIVLIDFGQAVDVRHPQSNDLLLRDATRVREFFHNQETKVLSVDEMLTFITQERPMIDSSSLAATTTRSDCVHTVSFLLDGRAVQKVKLRRYIESCGRYFKNVGGYVVNTPSGEVFGEAWTELSNTFYGKEENTNTQKNISDDEANLGLDGFRTWICGQYEPLVLTNVKPTPIGTAYPALAQVDRYALLEGIDDTFDADQFLHPFQSFTMVRDNKDAASLLEKRKDKYQCLLSILESANENYSLDPNPHMVAPPCFTATTGSWRYESNE